MNYRTILIAIELLACFIWPAYLLVIAMIMGILAIGIAFEGDFGGLIFLGFSTLGIAGLYGVAQVHLKLFKPLHIVERPWVILACLASGVTGIVLAYITMPVDGFTNILYISPILATGHYLYMLRGYLFGKAS